MALLCGRLLLQVRQLQPTLDGGNHGQEASSHSAIRDGAPLKRLYLLLRAKNSDPRLQEVELQTPHIMHFNVWTMFHAGCVETQGSRRSDNLRMLSATSTNTLATFSKFGFPLACVLSLWPLCRKLASPFSKKLPM